MAPPKKRAKFSSSSAPATTVLNQEVASSPSLQLFEKSPLQLVIAESLTEKAYLLDGWRGTNSDIVFSIPGDRNFMIIPNTLKLHAKVRLVNGDGSELVDHSKSAIDCQMLSTLFEKLTVRLGSTFTLCSIQHYAYYCYLMGVFLTSKTYRKQMKRVSGIYENTPANFDKTNEDNKGFSARQTLLAKSVEVYLVTPLYFSLQRQEHGLLNGVGLNVTLSRAPPAFSIMSGENDADQKAVIDEIYITYTKARAAPELELKLLQTVASVPAAYNIKSYSTCEVTALATATNLDALLLSEVPLPQVVMIMMLSTTRRIGSYTESCYDIDFKYLRKIELVVGSQVIPAPDGYSDINWQKRHIHRVYMDALKALGSYNSPYQCGLNFDRYLNGYGLIVFDLSKAQLGAESVVTELPSQGTLRLRATFKEGLTETQSFLCFFEYNNCVYVRSQSDITSELAL